MLLKAGNLATDVAVFIVVCAPTGWRTGSDVIDVNDMVDAVVLQDHFSGWSAAV
jgi:hypothetical protein